MDLDYEDPAYIISKDAHLHVQYREPASSTAHIDPTGLISSWGEPGFETNP